MPTLKWLCAQHIHQNHLLFKPAPSWISLIDLKRELAEKPALFTPWFDQALAVVEKHMPTF